jgi:hypothetical protein
LVGIMAETPGIAARMSQDILDPGAIQASFFRREGFIAPDAQVRETLRQAPPPAATIQWLSATR